MTDDWAGRLPSVNPRRLAVRVTPDALRQMRGGSPWVYDGSITGASHDGAAGDLAVVFDGDRRFAAIGLWDPASPIRLKVLHHGSPQTIDAAWWRGRVDAALSRREALVADPDTTGYRVVHGENDGLPGFVADRYADTLVVKLYSAAWFPHLVTVVDALVDATRVERVVLRLGRTVAAAETYGLADGTTLVGVAPTGPVVFRERGLVLEADVVRGQKTGHFLDQRDNRHLVRGMSAGADVLDVFASTGGFSLAAAAGGAASTLMTDLSAPALETARRNLDRNRSRPEVAACRVSARAGDAFGVLEALRADPTSRYDLIVVDPPSFAQNQASVERAVRAYRRLTTAALAVLRPGGTLVQCSCSSRVSADDFAAAVHGAARDAGRELRELRRTEHPIDHPIRFEHGAYLKAIYARA